MAAEPCLRALGLLNALLLLQGAQAYLTPNAYQVVIPQLLPKRGWPDPAICYSITLGERTYTVLLRLNWSPGHPGFAVYTQNRTGHLSPEPGIFPEHCFYQGVLEGIGGSAAALSNCHGLRGFLQTDTFTFAIEPVKDSSTFQHLVYRLDDVYTEPKPCFNILTKKTVMEGLYQRQQMKKAKHAARRVGRARYLKLNVIVDHDVFLYYSKNITLVTDVVFNIMNMADTMFTPLYLKLVLVGLQIWNVKNIIPASENVHTFLLDLVTWKEGSMIPSLKRYMTVLLRKDGIESLLGATFTGEICWSRNAVMFVSITGDVLAAAATQLAHELGHSIGIPHDTDQTRECHCILSSCIMLYSGAITTSFSECSLQYFRRFVDQGGGYCLEIASLDIFRSQYSRSYCGNKIVEEEEECDCGTVVECANDPCCDDTCKLKDYAQCSFGKCCIDCQFADIGVPCRKKVSECDLIEYCNGTSSVCPPDVYAQDGSPCNYNKSYCISNRCYDYNKHCKALFGRAAIVASRECFEAINTIGDQFGNCGFEDHNISPKKCEVDNAMCGRVQCHAVPTMHTYKSRSVTIETQFGDESCLSVVNHYSMIDIGAVEDGAPCDIGKICLARKCVNISLLRNDCDAQINCSGHGVCNSNNNCHCTSGWAPPDCKSKGHGGSIDSGPLLYKSCTDDIPEIKIDPPSESPVGMKRGRKAYSSDLAIGLGITLPVVTAGVILSVIFRQRIAALWK